MEARSSTFNFYAYSQFVANMQRKAFKETDDVLDLIHRLHRIIDTANVLLESKDIINTEFSIAEDVLKESKLSYVNDRFVAIERNIELPQEDDETELVLEYHGLGVVHSITDSLRDMGLVLKIPRITHHFSVESDMLQNPYVPRYPMQHLVLPIENTNALQICNRTE